MNDLAYTTIRHTTVRRHGVSEQGKANLRRPRGKGGKFLPSEDRPRKSVRSDFAAPAAAEAGNLPTYIADGSYETFCPFDVQCDRSKLDVYAFEESDDCVLVLMRVRKRAVDVLRTVQAAFTPAG